MERTLRPLRRGQWLDRPQVAAVIVGAINTSHLQSHEQIGSIQLMRKTWARLRP